MRLPDGVGCSTLQRAEVIAMTVFEALSLMIAFASLIVFIISLFIKR